MSIRKFNNIVPRIGSSTYIDDSAIVIGNVTIGDNVSIWPTTVIRGDVESITIGDDTNIQDGSVLHVTHYGKFTDRGYPLTIGKGVTVGHRVIAHACTIGNYCLIGMGAIVMDDAVIEDYVMLGAGALVPSGKTLESGHLYVGSPAKLVRPLKDSERDFLVYSSQHYIDLKNKYLEIP
ncbi:gamma carbonic anhydrase family protein [Methyloglobulus sp.]|uniref:gamma carbonic anhydrase family protein n=1 Tax=Methyloglobulus sp. TaxID=2518622 RepID=UPI0032B733D8